MQQLKAFFKLCLYIVNHNLVLKDTFWCSSIVNLTFFISHQANRWQEKFTQQQEILENLTHQQEILGNLTQKLQEIQEKTSQEKEDLQAKNAELSKSLQIYSKDDWMQNGKDCYYFSTKIKTWFECKEYCSSLSSRLLKIDSKEELVESILLFI
uniref:C-type lectin domain-containing protein n=1 Tax=Gopherus agassizii TaxID=38772 RepID=A0A452I928_9SAUR